MANIFMQSWKSCFIEKCHPKILIKYKMTDLEEKGLYLVWSV